MDAASIVFIVLLGAAVGSFLNLCADRLPAGISLVSPPSRCDRCHRSIPFYDLVPMVSYMLLGGKCRYCHVAIPVRVPLVEASTAALFGLAAWRHGISGEAWVLLGFISLFVLIAAIDLEHKLILNKLVIPGMLAAFLVFPFGPVGEDRGIGWAYVISVTGAAAGFGVMLLIYLASRGGMGEGDVKMGAAVGAAVGLTALPVALGLAFVAGGLAAVGALALRLKARGDVLPFGPFMAGAAIVALFAGEPIYDWYVDALR